MHPTARCCIAPWTHNYSLVRPKHNRRHITTIAHSHDATTFWTTSIRQFIFLMQANERGHLRQQLLLRHRIQLQYIDLSGELILNALAGVPHNCTLTVCSQSFFFSSQRL